MQNFSDLTGKVAIITGASSGMGYAMAKLFAAQGAKVVAVAPHIEPVDDLNNPNIITVPGDVTKAEDLENVVKITTENFGKIDILINNAGVMDNMLPLASMDDATYEKVININLGGVAKLSRLVLKTMLAQKSGTIINIASVGGLYGCRAGAAYTASKHAVVGLTKNTAFMYANEGIRCNAICPGAVATNIAKNSMQNPDQFGLSRAMAGIQLNPKTGDPMEIAQLALFLASDAASFVNGAIITADAGWSAY